MKTLIVKDFRLSLDGLLPWGLVVAGLVLGGLALLRLPPTMAPTWTGLSSTAEMLHAIAALIAFTAPFVAAACTALIVHGDRRHGAASLMGSLPIDARARIGSCALVVVLAATVPMTVALLLNAVALRLEGRAASPLFDALEGEALLIGVLGSAVAVGLTLCSAALVRSPLRATLVALIVGVGAVLLGMLGHALVIGSALREYREEVERIGSIAMTSDLFWLDSVANEALATAAVLALVVTATVGAAIGLVGMIRARRARWTLTLLALSAIVPVAAGAISTVRTVERTVGASNRQFVHSILARNATDADVISAIERGSTGTARPGDWRIIESARQHLLTLSETDRTRHPVFTAYRDAYRNLESRQSAEFWLHFSVDPLAERLIDAVTVLETWPTSSHAATRLLFSLREREGVDWVMLEAPPGTAWAEAEVRRRRWTELGQALMAASEAANSPPHQQFVPDDPALVAAIEAHRADQMTPQRERQAQRQELAARLRLWAEEDGADARRLLALAERIERLAESGETD